MGTINLSDDPGIDPRKKQNSETLKKVHAPSGMAGSTKHESKPEFLKNGSDSVWRGYNSCFAIFGRDRIGVFEGKSFEPHGKDGCIDLVVGLASASKIPVKDKQSYPPSVSKDSARLYLSQRSDVDNYFGLARGSIPAGITTDNKSCAVLKSDHTRIIGKQHVKIIAGKMKIKAKEGELTTLGGKNEMHGGIDLIAGNYTEGENALQPLVKGKYLLDMINDLIIQINSINDRVYQNQLLLSNLGSWATQHVHLSNGTPSLNLLTGITPSLMDNYGKISVCPAVTMNLGTIKTTYLRKEHDLHINSKLVKTT